MLKANHVSVVYGDTMVVQDVSFHIAMGDWFMILGPNGAGKSSLLKALTGVISSQGRVELLGQAVQSYRPAERAQAIGFLSQVQAPSYAYRVEDVVQLGRYAYHNGPFARLKQVDQQKVAEALALTGLETMRQRTLDELSGGEVQRVFLAQVFAQDPQVLLLDEPTNHLDLAYQEEILSHIEHWLNQGNRAVISVMHDLTLARAYGNRGLLLANGRVIRQGNLSNVLSSANLEAAYGFDVQSLMQGRMKLWDV